MNRKDTMILSYEHEDVTITLDEMEVISNRLLRDPKATEIVSQYLDDIKTSNPALHMMLDEETRQLAAMPGSRHFYALHGCGGAVEEEITNEHPLDEMTNVASGVYINGVLKHPCANCGTLYDRKARANDCRNADLGIKPYKCLGKCGFDSCDKEYACKQLLTRHCGEQVKKCTYCQKYRSTQNYSRHLKSCAMRP